MLSMLLLLGSCCRACIATRQMTTAGLLNQPVSCLMLDLLETARAFNVKVAVPSTDAQYGSF